MPLPIYNNEQVTDHDRLREILKSEGAKISHVHSADDDREWVNWEACVENASFKLRAYGRRGMPPTLEVFLVVGDVEISMANPTSAQLRQGYAADDEEVST